VTTADTMITGLHQAMPTLPETASEPPRAAVPLLNDRNVVLVGAGKMGGALLEGWIGLGVDPARVAVIEPQPAPAITALAARGLRINPDVNPDLAPVRPDAIVIAVKPPDRGRRVSPR